MSVGSYLDLIKKLESLVASRDGHFVTMTMREAKEILEALRAPESKIPAGPKQEPSSKSPPTSWNEAIQQMESEQNKKERERLKNLAETRKSNKETPYSYHLPLTREEFLAVEAAIENELAHSLPYRKLLQEYRSILVQVSTKILLKKSELL